MKKRCTYEAPKKWNCRYCLKQPNGCYIYKILKFFNLKNILVRKFEYFKKQFYFFNTTLSEKGIKQKQNRPMENTVTFFKCEIEIQISDYSGIQTTAMCPVVENLFLMTSENWPGIQITLHKFYIFKCGPICGTLFDQLLWSILQSILHMHPIVPKPVIGFVKKHSKTNTIHRCQCSQEETSKHWGY